MSKAVKSLDVAADAHLGHSSLGDADIVKVVRVTPAIFFKVVVPSIRFNARNSNNIWNRFPFFEHFVLRWFFFFVFF